jgi:hypothetical protein
VGDDVNVAEIRDEKSGKSFVRIVISPPEVRGGGHIHPVVTLIVAPEDAKQLGELILSVARSGGRIVPAKEIPAMPGPRGIV